MKKRNMNARQRAKLWLANKNLNYKFHASKLHTQNLWFFTLPCKYFLDELHEDLILLLEQEDTSFLILKIPKQYLADNADCLSIRENNTMFDLHIVALKNNYLTCARSNQLSFKQFVL